MREIKFRAWDREEKFMLQDIHSMYDGSCNHKETEERYGWISCFDSFIDNDNYVVMQYTGLKDKNGKEIYDGDIMEKGDFLYLVEWRNITIWLKPLDKWSIEHEARPTAMNMGSGIMRKVIGNIYENPELLK